MPELPEVETVVRGLRASLVGRTVVEVKLLWPGSVAPSDPANFARRLAGRTIMRITRRGKWIVVALSGDLTLLVHLRMTGRLSIERADCLDDRHLRALFLLDDGRRVHFFDQRKFGRLLLTQDAAQMLGKLGPEPLSDAFTAARFQEMVGRRRGRIKPLLMNQTFLAGLGNIYTDEALWRAQIHPLRRADRLTPDEVRRLHASIRSVLRDGLAGGGTTLADGTFRQPDGSSGQYAEELAVYGRSDEPCPRCGEAIERITVGQRGTHVCPRCQPRTKGKDLAT